MKTNSLTAINVRPVSLARCRLHDQLYNPMTQQLDTHLWSHVNNRLYWRLWEPSDRIATRLDSLIRSQSK
jgi:hypothetical protein